MNATTILIQSKKIDPTTSQKEYTNEQVVFMKAVELYQKKTNRKFLTTTEYLDIVKSLGYKKVGFSS